MEQAAQKIPVPTPPPFTAISVESDGNGLRALPFPPWKPPSDTRRSLFVFALWIASFLLAEILQAAALYGFNDGLESLPLWRGILAATPLGAAMLWTVYAGWGYGAAFLVAASFFASPVLPPGALYAGPAAMGVYFGLLRSFRFHTALRNWSAVGLYLFAVFSAVTCLALLSRKFGSTEMLLVWERHWVMLALHCLIVLVPTLYLCGPLFEGWKTSLFGSMRPTESGLRPQIFSFACGMVLLILFCVAWTLSIDQELARQVHQLNTPLDDALRNTSLKRGLLVAVLVGTVSGGAALVLLLLRRYRDELRDEIRHSAAMEHRWRDQISTLNSISSASERNPENDALIHDILQQFTLLTEADGAAAFFPDPEDAAILRLSHSVSAPLFRDAIARTGTLGGQCFASGLQALETTNASTSKDLAKGTAAEVESVLCIPIQGERRTLGVVSLAFRRAFTPDTFDQPILLLIGGILGAALERNEMQLKARQYAGDLSGLYRFSQQLLVENEDEGIYKVAAPAACKLLNASCAAVFSLRRVKTVSTIECTAVSGPAARVAMLRELTFSLDEEGAIATSIREGRAFDTGRQSDGTQPLALIPGWTESCAIVVPLHSGAKDEPARGVLAISFDIPRGLALEEVGLAEEIARQTAAALRRVHLLRTNRHQAEELRILDQLGRTMSERLDMTHTLNETVTQAPKLVGAAYASVLVLDPNTSALRMRATTIPHPKAMSLAIKLDQVSIVADCLRSGMTLVSNDMPSDPRCNKALNEEYKTRACVCVPLGPLGRRFGVLMVSDPEPATFGPDEVRLIEQAGQLASAAIDRARIYEDARLRTDELILLNEVGHLLVENPVLEITLQRIAALLERNVEVQGLAFLLSTDANDALVVRGAAGNGWEAMKLLRVDFGANDLTTAACHARQQSVLVAPDGEALHFQIAPEARSVAVIPLLQPERCAGVLCAWRLQSIPFKPQEVQRLTHVARLAASAIARESLGKQLRASEALLQDVVDGIEALIVSIDREGNIRSFNATAERLSGIARHEVLGKPMARAVCSAPRDQQRLFNYVARAFESGTCGDKLEFAWLPRSGRERKVRWSGSFLHGADGRTNGMVFLGIDITEQLGLEAQLRQAQKMESVGTLAGGMAHDFNNLLGGIIGQCTLMRAQYGEEDILADGLSKVEAAAQRGADLTAKLMAFARKSVLQPRSVDIGALITETVDLLGGSLPRRIQVSRKISPLLPPVFGDPTQLQQVLLNLCVNARDAMPQGGTLTISAAHIADPTFGDGAGGVLVEVSDTGTGMSEDVQQRLFEPFFTTKAPGKGTGLGLSVVFGIVRSHGGEIACYSRLNEGTRFSIRLPAMPRGTSGLYRATPTPSVSRFDLPVTPTPLAFNVTSLRGSENLLLIDDDNIVRDTVGSLLNTLGYNVKSAPGGLEALALLDSPQPFAPSIVVLDVVMPGLSGLALYKELAKRLPNVPVVLISGYSQDQTVQDLLAAGARELVQKPFTLETIAAALRRNITAQTSAT